MILYDNFFQGNDMKPIWRKNASLNQLHQLSANTMVEHTGIEFTEIGDDYLRATMPVDSRTHQPFGLLHGGASVVLAETVGSMAGNLVIDESQYCVGLEINANHVRPVKKGLVEAEAKPLALGRTTQVWDIRIKNDQNKLVCVARLTLAVRKIKETAAAPSLDG